MLPVNIEPKKDRTYWRDMENCRSFFTSYAQYRGFDPLIPANWASVNFADLRQYKVPSFPTTRNAFLMKICVGWTERRWCTWRVEKCDTDGVSCCRLFFFIIIVLIITTPSQERKRSVHQSPSSLYADDWGPTVHSKKTIFFLFLSFMYNYLNSSTE